VPTLSILEQRVPCTYRCIFHTLGAILYQPGEGDIDQPIDFARRKFSIAEKNYTTVE
jgi:hypothetical protein